MGQSTDEPNPLPSGHTFRFPPSSLGGAFVRTGEAAPARGRRPECAVHIGAGPAWVWCTALSHSVFDFSGFCTHVKEAAWPELCALGSLLETTGGLAEL